MQALSILFAIYIAAAGLIHFGPREALVDDPNMTVEEQIEHERMADLAAARLHDVWLEPEDVG